MRKHRGLNFTLGLGDPYFERASSSRRWERALKIKLEKSIRCYATRDLVHCLTEFQLLLYTSMSH